MKTGKHLFLSFLAILLSILMAGSAYAVAFPVNPQPSVGIGGGGFSYDGTNLTFTSDPTVLNGGYVNGDIFNGSGTFHFPSPGYIGPTDPIYGASISITSPLVYDHTESDSTYNYHYFTGGSLAIKEGTTTYLTGDFGTTIFRQPIGSGTLVLNPNEDQANIGNIWLDTSLSRFLAEFEDQSLHGYGFNRPAGSEIFGSFNISLSVTSGSADFSQRIASTGSDGGGFIRSAVPEPSSLLLLASGLAGLGGLAKKRRFSHKD